MFKFNDSIYYKLFGNLENWIFRKFLVKKQRQTIDELALTKAVLSHRTVNLSEKPQVTQVQDI